jgi:glycosyltransferase involved in cell wall biosynthesis
LASSCETPGIALIEAAALGARPAVTREGSAAEYFGFEAEYFHPLDGEEIRAAVKRAWDRGPLSSAAELGMRQITWEATAQATLRFYQEALARRDMTNAERRS